MRMTHKQKTTLARNLMTPLEIARHTPIFSSRAWNKRRRAGLRKMFRGCKTLRVKTTSSRLAEIMGLKK